MPARNIVRVAAAQLNPVLDSTTGTVDKVLKAIADAAREGAQLIVFPETVVPYYPYFSFVTPAVSMGAIHLKLYEHSPSIPGPVTDAIAAAAKAAGMVVVLGVNERDHGTLYNAQVIFDADGTMLLKRRKITPTYHERMVWGMGDASGLRVVDTPAGRLTCLICWESYMPLARYALYAQNVDILVNPTWDSGELCLATLRHIAREGGCWVIGTATAMQGSDIPADFPERDRLFKTEEWINDGDAVVVKPGGAIAAGPLKRDKGILYADIDLDTVGRARRSLDVSGHYSRPDIFSLSVNRKPVVPVIFQD